MSDHRRIALLEEQIKQLQSAQATSTYSYSHPPASEEPTPQFSGPGPDQARQYAPLEQHIHPESSQHLRRFPYGRRVLRTGNHTPRWSGQIDDRSDAMWELQSTECVKELVKRVERLEHWWRSNMEKQHAESRLHSAPEIQRSNLNQPNPQYVQAQTPTSNSGRHSNNISFTSPAPSLRIPREVPHPELSITQLPQPSLRSYEPQMTTPYILNQPQSSAFIDQDLHPSYPQDLVTSTTAGHSQPAPEQQYPQEPLTDGFREKFDFWSGLA
ncbi:hypothetical protein DL95DRAFT_487648 [Leptodontidium sp. 2 PMI_412]|nr:hypothetical protein DL95DRAFT_487648 [Leptodontidium sp. 2 PMI_412]